MIHSYHKAIHMGTNAVPKMSFVVSVPCWVFAVFDNQSSRVIKI